MLAVAFLLVSLAAGVGLAWAIPVRALRFEDRAALAVPLGLGVGSLLTFLLALAFGLNELTLGVAGSLLVIGAIEAGFREGWRKRMRADWRELRERVRRRRGLPTLLVYLLMAGLLAYVYWNSLFLDNNALWAGFSNIWGDWNQHLAQTNSFIHGENLPPEFNSLAGHKITYPFLTNFLSAALVKGGLGLITAMKLPGVLLAWSGLVLLGTLTRLTIGKWLWLAPLLFYFSGGLGFVNFVTDLMENQASLGHFLSHLPHTYTSIFDDGLPISQVNWINSIFAFLVPQRAFLFGLPLLLGTVSLLWIGLRDRNRVAMLSAGLVACLLPLIHTHSLVFLGLFTAALIPLTRRHLAGRAKPRLRHLRLWLWFVGPILAVALPQVLWLTAGTQMTKFLRFQYGWTKGNGDLIWFWLQNAGVFIPLLLAGLYAYRRTATFLVRWTLASGFIFILANLFVFQPWDWDNTKLLVYWFILSIPLVVLVLSDLAGRFAVGAAVLIAALVFAGAADVARTVQPDAYRVNMFDQTGLEIGQAVIDRSPPRSVWVTAQTINNPVSVLGGRRVVLGYSGNLWSYGLDYSEQERDVKAIYEAHPGVEEVLRRRGVDFVVIGEAEKLDKGFRVNEDFYRARFPVWGTFGPVTVYDVRPLTEA